MTKITRRIIDNFILVDERNNSAMISVDPEVGHVVINCSDREIAGDYYWGNRSTGCESIYEFLCKNGHDWHYFMLKFFPRLFHTFDEEKTRAEFKRLILQHRREGRLDTVQARNLWANTENATNEYEFMGLDDLSAGDCCMRYWMSPDVPWFANAFWLPFIEHIRSERAEFAKEISE